jgi:hypothetical protein
VSVEAAASLGLLLIISIADESYQKLGSFCYDPSYHVAEGVRADLLRIMTSWEQHSVQAFGNHACYPSKW